MRVYFEKPRTTVGWKGFINDPDMNSSFQINKGLRIARTLLLDIAKLGLPAGCEFLDTISPQYTADLVSWGAIGARTTESQVHRELTSGLSMPTGFKNSTDGSVGIAVDACRAARTPHVFLSVGKEGLSSIIETDGNPDVHVILRGGVKGLSDNTVAVVVTYCTHRSKLRGRVRQGLRRKAQEGGPTAKNHGELPQSRWSISSIDSFHSPMFQIDCSHGNSQKQYKKQLDVVNDIVSPSLLLQVTAIHTPRQVKQLSSPETGALIMGVMLESNLVEGRQEIPASGPAGLRYGQSVTDACISWEQTVPALDALRIGVQGRRDTVYRLARGLSLDV